MQMEGPGQQTNCDNRMVGDDDVYRFTYSTLLFNRLSIIRLSRTSSRVAVRSDHGRRNPSL
jgi:hypothetical protein